MQRYYHELPHRTNPIRQLPTIPGGSYSIPPLALIIVWAAYRQRKLGWLALRVWLALWEIKCWHEARANSDHTPYYDTSQIASAIRSPNFPTGRLKAALSTLQHLGIIKNTSSTIWIAASIDDLQDAELRHLATQMVSHIGHTNVARSLRMPRRMLVSLMISQRPRPVYAGVMFALLIRTMLTKRYETYKGCCTASWIAFVFGGDPSSIKSARAKLIKEGWFARLDTPQRIRQRYGEWVVLIIQQPVDNFAETEPPNPANSTRTEPPLKNQSLSHEIERNQFLQPGTWQPKWQNIQPLDLRTPKRREQLYQAALAAGVIPPTEGHRHTFFAAIAHATRVATRNTCGLLRRLLETPAYHRFISQADEDRASTWLHVQRPKMSLDVLSIGPANDNQHDRQVASYLRNRLKEAGFATDDCFDLIMTTQEGKTNLSGWTQARWEKATADRLEHESITHFGQITRLSSH